MTGNNSPNDYLLQTNHGQTMDGL